MTDVRDQSERLLAEFLAFCRAQGVKPVVLGGWAVYAFAGKEKSVDVDFLVPDEGDLAKIAPFFAERGFKKTVDRRQAVAFEKTLDIGGRAIELFFEVFRLEEANAFKEDPKLEVPWRLAEQHATIVKHANQEMGVPSIELLLAYKLKARRDRTHAYFTQKAFLHPKTRAKLREKMDKDERDVKSLLATNRVSQTRLQQLLAELNPGARALLEETLKEIASK